MEVRWKAEEMVGSWRWEALVRGDGGSVISDAWKMEIGGWRSKKER